MKELEKVIGKQVWVLRESGYTYILDKDHTYTVIGRVEIGHNLPDGTVNNDFVPHLVIINENGTTEHIREYCAIITPDMSIKDDACRISKYLSDNTLYAEVFVNSEGCPAVSISWGDWKHDHGFCDSLMRYIGYSCDDVVVTEENGSDCYSADHYYSKAE